MSSIKEQMLVLADKLLDRLLWKIAAITMGFHSLDLAFKCWLVYDLYPELFWIVLNNDFKGFGDLYYQDSKITSFIDNYFE